MDRNFHIDDFERLLREKSDEFRMYPSKRIWHSIYNNIHPGRKWPSVAMSITLITSLFLLGYLNTKNTNLYSGAGNNMIVQKIILAPKKSAQSYSQNLVDHPGNSIKTPGTIANLRSGAVSNNALKINSPNEIVRKSSRLTGLASTLQPFFSGDKFAINGQATTSNPRINETVSSFNTGINAVPESTGQQTDGETGDKITAGDDQSVFLTYAQKTVINDFLENIVLDDFGMREDMNKKMSVAIQGGNSTVEKNKVAVNKKDIISAEDKAWIENYALYNRPATKKWANKLSWEIYATPSVVYRDLFTDLNFSNSVNPAPIALSASGQDINKAVNQKPSVGFEIGAGYQYSISKGIKLKAGLQLNYTRYNSEAFQNAHPVATKLTMHDYEKNMSYEVFRTTPFSNKYGLEAVRLHNETYQVSLPIGADLKLIGDEFLQWNLGITIQPTYVPAGKSYLISSDRRNYVKETSMFNRWNLNAGFETFISYKTDNGLTWQIGPQFRTQLFSTNKKQIAVEEKLLSYGLKIGVSKTLK